MEIVQQQIRAREAVKYLTGVRGIFFFALLQSILSSLKIPLGFTPVPLTLQTAVLFASVLFLKEKAAFAQALYILLGCIGFPAFSAPSWNALYLLGPTGGYLVGFFVASVIMGYAVTAIKETTIYKLIALFAAGTAIIYGCGVSWLMMSMSMSIQQALIAGVYPFIMGDGIKIILVAFLGGMLTRKRSS